MMMEQHPGILLTGGGEFQFVILYDLFFVYLRFSDMENGKIFGNACMHKACVNRMMKEGTV